MFPSPCGVYIFSIHDLHSQRIWQEVSVPLRGLYLLYTEKKNGIKIGREFPSPCGGYIFSMHGNWQKQDRQTVSVPLRGLYLLYLLPEQMKPSPLSFRPLAGFISSLSKTKTTCDSKSYRVSVPLRGLYLLYATWRSVEAVLV